MRSRPSICTRRPPGHPALKSVEESGNPRIPPGAPTASLGNGRAQPPLFRAAAAGRPVADEADLRLYLVEHDLRGLSPAQLVSVHRALGEAVRRETRRGSQIRYAQRIDVPEEHRCLCLFEATGPEAVRSVNDIAQFPLARVVAVLSSVPDGSGRMPGPGTERTAGRS